MLRYSSENYDDEIDQLIINIS